MKCPICGGRHLVKTEYQNWYFIGSLMLINILFSPHIAITAIISTASFFTLLRGRLEKNKMICLDCGRIVKPIQTKQDGISKIDIL